jgi:hypothetical protein
MGFASVSGVGSANIPTTAKKIEASLQYFFFFCIVKEIKDTLQH